MKKTNPKNFFVILTIGGLIVLTSACAGQRCKEASVLENPASMLTMGDSIIAFNKSSCESVGDFVALSRGAAVQTQAENGARMSGSVLGITPVPEQYMQGNWEYVLLNGGINDLNGPCDCGQCDETLENLISADGTSGQMPQLITELAARGHYVLLAGYYKLPDNAWGGYAECAPYLDILHRRYKALAASRPDTTFVDFRKVMSPETTPELYYFDDLHPNAKGGEVLGRYVASFLAGAQEKRRRASGDDAAHPADE